ncbi:acyl carrier protein [Candidatus Bathyarchaeota archaeon]|nr:MAG: acyl carrier protein [Candidatus Bathyarchaeota archaeon]
MTSSAERRLREILAKVLLLDDSEINDELSRDDVEEWDSLAHLMLINEVESAFQVTFGDEDILSIRTVGDLKRVLKRLGVNI